MSRQVGARHGVMMKNAMVHFTMFEPYLKWCSHVKHKVKEANDLHLRVLTKLQTFVFRMRYFDLTRKREQNFNLIFFLT